MLLLWFFSSDKNRCPSSYNLAGSYCLQLAASFEIGSSKLVKSQTLFSKLRISLFIDNGSLDYEYAIGTGSGSSSSNSGDNYSLSFDGEDDYTVITELGSELEDIQDAIKCFLDNGGNIETFSFYC